MICTVAPHPTDPHAFVVIDPRMAPGVRLKFSDLARAEAFAATRNRYR